VAATHLTHLTAGPANTLFGGDEVMTAAQEFEKKQWESAAEFGDRVERA
jgi:hypothetical protein